MLARSLAWLPDQLGRRGATMHARSPNTNRRRRAVARRAPTQNTPPKQTHTQPGDGRLCAARPVVRQHDGDARLCRHRLQRHPPALQVSFVLCFLGLFDRERAGGARHACVARGPNIKQNTIRTKHKTKSAELALNMDAKFPGNIDYGANPELQGLTTGQVMDR